MLDSLNNIGIYRMKELKSIFVKIAMFRKLYDKDFLWGKKIFMEKSLNYNSHKSVEVELNYTVFSFQFKLCVLGYS